MLCAINKVAHSRQLLQTYQQLFLPAVQIAFEIPLRTLARRALIVAAHRCGKCDAASLRVEDLKLAVQLFAVDL